MNFINKVNKYLLEHYPLIWNTRLVWMVVANIGVHILFFIIGFSSANNLQDLKRNYNLENFFLDSSAIYYSLLISIVILLIWIVFYLRNNAFKNTYNLSKLMLFKQFCILFFIFFISITQFYSFRQGLVIKIKMTYDWEEVDADIKTFNETAVFLAQDQSDYEISEKQYPDPFPLKVAHSNKLFKSDSDSDSDTEDEDIYSLNYENKKYNIDITKPFIVKNKLYYQFYEIDRDLWNSDIEKDPNLFEYSQNDFKYRIVKDVSKFKELIHPSLLNYSKELFKTGQDSLAYQQQLQYHQSILENGDETEIKEALSSFLELTEKYEITHNLNVETWFDMVYNKPNYLLKELINQSRPDIYNISDNLNNSKSRYYDDIPYSEKLFVSMRNTDHVFENIYEAYFESTSLGLFYFFIGFAYCLALILFIFKTTSIKNLLLSIVASLLLLVIIVWLMSSTRYVVSNTDIASFNIMLLVSAIIIIFSIISYRAYWKKISTYILWSLGLFAVPVFVLFSCLTYLRILRENHLKMYPTEYDFRSNFELWFNDYGFLTILAFGFATVYLYAIYIRKLKARPE